ncbi:peptidoglycan-binding domain-containing protein [Aquicoccus sp. G2-2]|uniref:peptidoglycan-binding domain-containing protein n=1 Tax=Aquicoccus sp. G2-2 TaxID=3092120 RepID=UPI002ADF71F7|nr:peptidoglycan-binding domain-containing protein [Aquicoccus sp. G2-2]MEA1114341.1 peptidoglycan-binding domain-containing protein [Aquicoccus sp. G2-2]
MIPKPGYAYHAALAALLLLSACSEAGDVGQSIASGFSGPALVQTHERPPPGAAPDSCWGKDITPAVIETVTEDILVQPAQVQSDGTVTAPPIYKKETHQRIVKERRELWFETPCERQLTPDFIASLQRALQARGYYSGPSSGEVTPRTRRAVRRYQAAQGLDSAILSLAAARKLGLVAVARQKDE